jgi:hypothetical protein
MCTLRTLLSVTRAGTGNIDTMRVDETIWTHQMYSRKCSLQGEEEGEVYEVLNIRSLKQATPNLSVINLWGVSFVDDSHVEAFSSNCIQLAALSLNFCTRVQVKTYLIDQKNLPFLFNK